MNSAQRWFEFAHRGAAPLRQHERRIQEFYFLSFFGRSVETPRADWLPFGSG